MTTSKCSILLKIGLDDNMYWLEHYIPGLRMLHLNSGGKALLGRNPFIRRTLRGVFLESSLVSHMPHYSVLDTKKKVEEFLDPNMINPCRAFCTLDYPVGVLPVERREYEDRVARELREQLTIQLIEALENRDIYNIPERDIQRWITVNSETLDSGLTRFTATSRPIPVNTLRLANQ